MSLVWSKVNYLADYVRQRFVDNSLTEEYREELPGWYNYIFTSNKFRRAHIEIVDFREQHKIYILHVTVFPHTNDSSPILGFDAVCGPNKITGAFFDFSVSGYTLNYSADKTVFPVGGVYRSELLQNTAAELVDGELAPVRLTARGSVKTASDGHVNELVASISSGYDDVYIAEDAFAVNTLAPLTISGEFFDTTRTNTRFVYVPLIRSGWKNMTFSFKSAASGELQVYADYGALQADLLLSAFPVAADARYAVISTSASGSAFKSVPALSEPTNGVIISFIPAESVAGSLEIHIVRGA